MKTKFDGWNFVKKWKNSIEYKVLSIKYKVLNTLYLILCTLYVPDIEYLHHTILIIYTMQSLQGIARLEI